MEFRENVLKLLSNKISENDKGTILQEMEENAASNLATAGYLVYYYHEVEHEHDKHNKYEALLKGKNLKELAKNDSDLAYVVALLISASIIFDENISEMKSWFELSSKNGNPLADFEMGFYHYQIGLEGEESKKDSELKKALSYFDKARKSGLIEATLAMAELYIEIDDVENATKMFEDAVKLNDSDGYLGLALIEYDNQDFKKAKDLLLKSFNIDKNRIASFYLGGIYFDENDTKNGLFYLQESADQGNIDAMYDLGVLYLDGEVVEQDEKKAFDYFSYAAQRGDAGSQFYIGTFYKEGIIVEQSDEDAKYWLEAAADQGDEDAMELLNSF
jgi:hypothetical protein